MARWRRLAAATTWSILAAATLAESAFGLSAALIAKDRLSLHLLLEHAVRHELGHGASAGNATSSGLSLPIDTGPGPSMVDCRIVRKLRLRVLQPSSAQSTTPTHGIVGASVIDERPDGLPAVAHPPTSLQAQDTNMHSASARLSPRRGLAADSDSSSDPKAVRSVERVVRAALALLPKQPAYVSLIDVDAQDDARIRAALRPLEAFTLPGKHGVYLTLHGGTFRRALETRDERMYRFALHVLAAIVWHEMAHLSGADETGAQASEEKLFMQFIHDERLDIEPARRQMQIYASRRPRCGRKGGAPALPAHCR